MHNGSLPTLEAVLDHYAVGGRARYANSPAGAVPAGAAADFILTGFELAPEERRQLLAFLRALTDEDFVRRAQDQSVP